MRGKDDLLNYHLVFASQSPLGLEKMKEAMRGIDKSGSYCFSDGAVGMPMLFNFDDPKDYAEKLYKHFVSQTVSYPPVTKFALNETPFTNPISMLRVLDQQGLIDVVRYDAKSKGFSAVHLQNIRFLVITRTLPNPPTIHKQGGLFDGD